MFSRSSLGGIRQGIREGKRMAILIKVLFCNLEFLGRSLVRLSFILGLLRGAYIQEYKGKKILIIVPFCI